MAENLKQARPRPARARGSEWQKIRPKQKSANVKIAAAADNCYICSLGGIGAGRAIIEQALRGRNGIPSWLACTLECESPTRDYCTARIGVTSRGSKAIPCARAVCWLTAGRCGRAAGGCGLQKAQSDIEASIFGLEPLYSGVPRACASLQDKARQLPMAGRAAFLSRGRPRSPRVAQLKADDGGPVDGRRTQLVKFPRLCDSHPGGAGRGVEKGVGEESSWAGRQAWGEIVGGADFDIRGAQQA